MRSKASTMTRIEGGEVMIKNGIYTIVSVDQKLPIGIAKLEAGRKDPKLLLCDVTTPVERLRWSIDEVDGGFVTVSLATHPKQLWEDAASGEWLKLDEPDTTPHEQHWKFEPQDDGSFAIAHRSSRRHVSSEPSATFLAPPSAGVGQWVYLRPTSGAVLSGRWRVVPSA